MSLGFLVLKLIPLTVSIVSLDIDELHIPMMELQPLCLNDGSAQSEESLRYPTDDCLVTSLEYLGNRSHIRNFRRTSKHFNQIYDRYKIRQNGKFRDFRVLFQDNPKKNIH